MRSRPGSSLGIAAPIYLLALGVSAASDPTSAAVERVRARIEQSCPGPEGIDACTPSALQAELASDLGAVSANRKVLEDLWIADLAKGNHVAAYGLALLRSSRSLPALRARLLSERYFYGWETSTPDDPEILYSDEQFPRHRAMIQAIEWIAARPLRAVVTLTPGERRKLRRGAAGCDDWRAARWLLHKLEGAPLPATAANRKHRLRCEGPGFPGDPGFR